jgi:hypothetical protein
MSATDVSALMYIGFILLGIGALYATSKGYINSKSYYMYLGILFLVAIISIKPIS